MNGQLGSPIFPFYLNFVVFERERNIKAHRIDIKLKEVYRLKNNLGCCLGTPTLFRLDPRVGEGKSS